MPTPPNQIHGYHGSFSALVLTQDPQSDDPALLVRAILSTPVVNTLNQILASLQLLDDLVKNESTLHVSGDAGVQSLAVRNDTPTALASNGDYIPFTTDSTGRLWTNALVTNTTTNPVIVDLPFVTYQEDSPHNNQDRGLFVLAVRNDAGVAFAGNGDYIPFTTDSVGQLRTTAFINNNVSNPIPTLGAAVRNDYPQSSLPHSNLAPSRIAVDQNGVQYTQGYQQAFTDWNQHFPVLSGGVTTGVNSEVYQLSSQANSADVVPIPIGIHHYADDPISLRDLGVQVTGIVADGLDFFNSYDNDYSGLKPVLIGGFTNSVNGSGQAFGVTVQPYDFPINTVSFQDNANSRVVLTQNVGESGLKTPSGANSNEPIFVALVPTPAAIVSNPSQGTLSVASTTVPQPLTTVSTLVRGVIIKARRNQATPNTSNVYVGFSPLDGVNAYELQPGEDLSINAPDGSYINLNQIYVDVTTNNDGVIWLAYQ